nr:hypothetical protein CFP56_76416 [Quercus suber]
MSCVLSKVQVNYIYRNLKGGEEVSGGVASNHLQSSSSAPEARLNRTLFSIFYSFTLSWRLMIATPAQRKRSLRQYMMNCERRLQFTLD